MKLLIKICLCVGMMIPMYSQAKQVELIVHFMDLETCSVVKRDPATKKVTNIKPYFTPMMSNNKYPNRHRYGCRVSITREVYESEFQFCASSGYYGNMYGGDTIQKQRIDLGSGSKAVELTCEYEYRLDEVKTQGGVARMCTFNCLENPK